MIYRIITEFRMILDRYVPEKNEYVRHWIIPKERAYQELTGGDCFADVMNNRGLSAPTGTVTVLLPGHGRLSMPKFLSNLLVKSINELVGRCFPR